MADWVRRLLRDSRGATAVEYALIIGLVALVLVGALATIGGNLSNSFQQVSTAINR